MSSAFHENLIPSGIFSIVCTDSHGNIRWTDKTSNMVVTQGKNDLLNKYFNGSNYSAGFFVGLKSSGDISSSDTMTSHLGWTEIITYTNSSRPAFSASTSSLASVNNGSSLAVFLMNGIAQVAGCFISTSSLISGISGVLFSAANFTSVRNTVSGDRLLITYTVSC